jgi:hypothetical protein
MTDHIWNQYLGTSFVTAKEKIIEDLKSINQQTAFLDQNNKNQDLEKMSEQLSSTLEGLRDITIKQACLTNHAKFQEKLTKEIDSRNLGKFYSFEETLLNSRSISKESKKEFLDIISLRQLNVKDIEIHKNDILRLSIIYYLINQSITAEEIKEIEKYLSNSGISIQALNYFKEKRSFEESMRKAGGNNGHDLDRSFLQKSISYFVKRITTSEQTSIISEIVNNLASNKEVREYNTYNLIKKGMEKVNTNFNQVIVFVIGGGSLAEFEYLDESLNKNDRTVIK